MKSPIFISSSTFTLILSLFMAVILPTGFYEIGIFHGSFISQIIYYLCGFSFLVIVPGSIWNSGHIFYVYDDRIVKLIFFGIFGSEYFLTSDFKSCRFKTDSSGILWEIKITTSKNQKLSFNLFQSNFSKLKDFISYSRPDLIALSIID